MFTESVDFALAERQGVVDEIIANHEKWSAQIGATVISANVIPETGEVVVGIDGEVPYGSESVLIGDTPISVESIEFKPQAGHRRGDQGNWTGGNWMNRAGVANTEPALCTLGFVWRVWGVGGLFGGTALHCIRITGVTAWYHNLRHMGTFARSASASDSALLAPAPATAFGPTVWVGHQWTTVERTVVGANAVPERNTDVALSGANSGLNTMTIIDDRHDIVGTGPVVVTDDDVCVGGDSGAPWLTTLSAPPRNAIAHGQHVGELFYAGADRCVYLPVSQISAALSASIATG